MGHNKSLIKRTTADRVIKEIIERAKEINNDDSYTYGVKALYVFGSYLTTDKPMIGDLDILVDTYWKDDIKDPIFNERVEAERKLCNRGSFIDHIYYPFERVIRRLKNRSRTLSLHRIDEKDYIGEHKLIYDGSEYIFKGNK